MSTYLIHHGIKGQRWGVRRFQNPDGSLTPEGKKRLYKEYRREKGRMSDENYNQARKRFDVDAKELQALKLKQKYGIEDDDDWRQDDWYKHEGRSKYETAKRNFEEADREASKFAREKTHKELLKKYGEDTLSELEKEESKRAAIAVGAGLVAGLGALVLLSATDSSRSSSSSGHRTTSRKDERDNVVWEAEYKEVHK